MNIGHVIYAVLPQQTCVERPPRGILLAVESHQAELAPRIDSWANSMIAMLEAVRKMLKQQAFEDVVDIFD